MIALDYRTLGWPDAPVDAAALFYRHCVPEVRQTAGRPDLAERDSSGKAIPEAIGVMLPEADYTHADWRRAAIGQLARECAPVRVNAIVGADGHAAIGEVMAYLASAAGVTGQIFTLDANPGESA